MNTEIINRVEIIDYRKEYARDYVTYCEEGAVAIELQDDGHTMKIFINKKI